MTAEPLSDAPPGAVLIVDDHDLVGAALMFSLRAEGIAAHRAPSVARAAVLAAAGALPPGVALLDLELGRDPVGRALDGGDLVAPLRALGWRVIILSGSSDHARIGAALAAGALAWVPKHATLPTLLATVRAAVAGDEVMPAARHRQLVEVYHRHSAERRELTAKLDRLTQRERQVLAELARGNRAQAVAERFVVSIATVRSQIRAVLGKLEVGSQLEAVAIYRRAADS